MTLIPAVVAGICDDAAIFPPGLARLEDAVPAHLRHESSEYAELVGPLIVGVAVLDELAGLVQDLPSAALAVSVTVPTPDQVGAVRAGLESMPGVRLEALEVALPAEMPTDQVVPALEAATSGLDVPVFVEVPRDARRPGILAALATTRYLAKFRTGGVKAELYPDEAELAAAIAETTRLGLPFKATAGLHHAIRNTDPETTFEQHGFLNILCAVDAALLGADETQLVTVLSDRHAPGIAQRIAGLSADRVAAARRHFISFGTCSVTDPLTELTELGLIGAGSA
ncbi:MAG TPA: hypothetical protein VES01_02375 [Dermatophilaceae bacterium]|nr:hypothetical protein [Dermatophilaceae bacterium]